jgi:hypothetical protein
VTTIRQTNDWRMPPDPLGQLDKGVVTLRTNGLPGHWERNPPPRHYPDSALFDEQEWARWAEREAAFEFRLPGRPGIARKLHGEDLIRRGRSPGCGSSALSRQSCRALQPLIPAIVILVAFVVLLLAN